MALITRDELLRGVSLLVFGSAAGLSVVAFPGSPVWVLPAALGTGGFALTIPEVREEVQRLLAASPSAPQLPDGQRGLLPALRAELAAFRSATPAERNAYLLRGEPLPGLPSPQRPALPAPVDGSAAAPDVVAVQATPAAPARPVRRTAPRDPNEEMAERGRTILQRDLYNSDPTQAWGPTLIAARPRWGKSQVQVARIVEDIDAGHEVVWMSPHLTLYHPTDQPTDLRPLANQFEQLGEPKKIRDRLHYYVDTVLEQRMQRYRRGEDVGHPIALHVGEWPMLVKVFGQDVTEPMQRLIYEAPKAQIIVSTLDAQDAHVNTLGLGSGVREAFWTKLLGGVDQRTWEVFTDEPYRRLESREWFVPGHGPARFPLPDAQRIQQVVARFNPAPAPASQVVARAIETPAPERHAAPDPADALAALLAEPVPDGPSVVRTGHTVVKDERGDTHVHVYAAAHSGGASKRDTPVRRRVTAPRPRTARAAAATAPKPRPAQSDAQRIAAYLEANPELVIRSDAGVQLRRGAKSRIAEQLGITYSGPANCERIDAAAIEGLQLLSSR